MQTGIQSRAALERLFRNDGTPAGPLSTAHGALDGRRPVFVCAVFTSPLGDQLGHRRTATEGGFPPFRGDSQLGRSTLEEIAQQAAHWGVEEEYIDLAERQITILN